MVINLSKLQFNCEEQISQSQEKLKEIGTKKLKYNNNIPCTLVVSKGLQSKRKKYDLLWVCYQCFNYNKIENDTVE